MNQAALLNAQQPTALITKSSKPAVKDTVSACFLCAGYCGVIISLDEDDRVVKVVGDKKNPNSKGFICNKGSNLFTSLDNPNRLTQPLKRINGDLVEISWDQALDEITEKLRHIRTKRGARSLALAFGGAEANTPPMMLGTLMMNMLGSHSVYNPSGLEFLARFLVGEKMYGAPFIDGHPDFDNANYIVIIGSNPLVSCPPEGPALKKAGKSEDRTLVVIDPRKTETAHIANKYLGIRISADVYFLLAMLNVIINEALYDDEHVKRHSLGLEQVANAIKAYTPQVAQIHTGIAAQDIIDVARGYANAPRAVLNYHMGVIANHHATLVAWLVQTIKFITNNKGKKGGSLINPPLIDMNSLLKLNKNAPIYESRTRKDLKHISGCLPTVMMADEILTPGEGQIRALIASSCNPLKGYGDAQKMEQAFDDLELLVSIDPFLTEVGRKAHYVLPTCSYQEQENIFFAHPWMFKTRFVQLLRKIREPRGQSWPEWKIYREIGKRTGPQGMPNHILNAAFAVFDNWHRLLGTPGGFNQQLGFLKTVVRLCGLRWQSIAGSPNGLNIQDKEPYNYLEKIGTEDKKVHLAIGDFMQAVSQLPLSGTPSNADFPLLLSTICRSKANTNTMFHNLSWERKHERENNLKINTEDAMALGINDGDVVTLETDVASDSLKALVTDDVVSGTVHLTHGWGLTSRQLNGHADVSGVAAGKFSSHDRYDTFTGMPVLSGVPCRVLLPSTDGD